MDIIEVNTQFEPFNTNQRSWMQQFNQAAFINYDTTGTVTLNNTVVIPPAQLSGADVIPTQFIIALNVGEVNATNFSITFQGTNKKLVIAYTTYGLITKRS